MYPRRAVERRHSPLPCLIPGVRESGAAARVAKSELSELVVTDTIYTGEPDPMDCKIRRLSIAPLLAEAIRRISDEASVSSLFD